MALPSLSDVLAAVRASFPTGTPPRQVVFRVPVAVFHVPGWLVALGSSLWRWGQNSAAFAAIGTLILSVIMAPAVLVSLSVEDGRVDDAERLRACQGCCDGLGRIAPATVTRLDRDHAIGCWCQATDGQVLAYEQCQQDGPADTGQ